MTVATVRHDVSRADMKAQWPSPASFAAGAVMFCVVVVGVIAVVRDWIPSAVALPVVAVLIALETVDVLRHVRRKR